MKNGRWGYCIEKSCETGRLLMGSTDLRGYGRLKILGCWADGRASVLFG